MPIVLGHSSLFFRDVANFHWPAKLEQIRAWQSGVLPFVDLWRGGGQAGVGNLNTLALYPSNLLLAVLPTLRLQLWGFNAHFWLHLLLAPLAFRWMARELGIGREGAWMGAVLYATSGFAVSLLSFYNLIAALLLIPALVAASLRTMSGTPIGRARVQPLLVLGVCWTLLLLAGDPLSAAIGLLVAISAVACTRSAGERKREGSTLVLTALVLGTLMAWPQLNELRLAMEESVRTTLGYSTAGVMRGSVPPLMVLDSFLPFVLGAPNQLFWAARLHGGAQPLFFTFFPGAIGLCLLLVGVTRLRWRVAGRTSLHLGLLWFAAGLFFCLGVHNPVVAVLSEWGAASWMRFPVKFGWLAVLGLGMVGAWVVDALSTARPQGLSRVLRWSSGLLALGYSAIIVAVASGHFLPLYELVIGGARAERAAAEAVPRLLGAALLGLAACATLWVASCWQRMPKGAWLLLVVGHAASQMVLLRPVYPTIPSGELLAPSAILSELAPETLVVHGSVGGGFGTHLQSQETRAIDISSVQMSARAAGYPFAGVGSRLRYQFNSSPEGLDSYRPGLLAQILRRVDDGAKVKLLEAAGATHLVTERPVSTAGLVLEHRTEAAYRYRLAKGRPLLAVTRWVIAATPQETIQAMLDERFDVTSTVVVPSGVPPIDTSVGRAPPIITLQEADRHRLRLQVASEAVAMVAVDRAYLPRYRATVDGEPVVTVAANLTRLAAVVPPGNHELVFEFDRSHWWRSVLISFGSVLLLGVLARRTSRLASN